MVDMQVKGLDTGMRDANENAVRANVHMKAQ